MPIAIQGPAFQKLILEYSSKDPYSFAFRFPSDKAGKNYLPTFEIDIRNFGEVMSKVSTFLESITDLIEDR